ncbi:MAG: hypothetical protein JO110_27485 [Acetobacteraceae bacterium]|nr:hypothetical protein [Acetobacteraceae bacterium]
MDPARRCFEVLKGKGWTPAQACGIVANIKCESNFNPAAAGDGGHAYGLAQWHPPRQTAFEQKYKHDIRGSSFEEQLDFIDFEMTSGGEWKAGRLLKAAKTAEEAGEIVSRDYERPASRDSEARKRGELAKKYFELFQGAVSPAVAEQTSPVANTGNIKMPDINYVAVAEHVASGAAAGLAFGPVGAGLGAMIGFATEMVPPLFPHFFGKNSAKVQAAVKTALAGATGGSTDLKDVQAAIAADPSKRDAIKQQLADIAAQEDKAQHQDDIETMKAALADTANARAETEALVKAGSPIAWGAPIVSAIVLLTFAAVLIVDLVSQNKDNVALFNVALGTVGTMATAVVTYWVGSSAGSQHKTALLAKAQPIP